MAIGVVGFASLSWWQIVVIGIIAVLCLFLDKSYYQLASLSVNNPKEIWELGMDNGDEIEIWQAYLNDIKVIDMVCFKTIKVTFYVIEPSQYHHSAFIFRSGISEADFRRLTTLAKFGGYH